MTVVITCHLRYRAATRTKMTNITNDLFIRFRSKQSRGFLFLATCKFVVLLNSSSLLLNKSDIDEPKTNTNTREVFLVNSLSKVDGEKAYKHFNAIR